MWGPGWEVQQVPAHLTCKAATAVALCCTQYEGQLVHTSPQIAAWPWPWSSAFGLARIKDNSLIDEEEPTLLHNTCYPVMFLKALKQHVGVCNAVKYNEIPIAVTEI